MIVCDLIFRSTNVVRNLDQGTENRTAMWRIRFTFGNQEDISRLIFLFDTQRSQIDLLMHKENSEEILLYSSARCTNLSGAHIRPHVGVFEKSAQDMYLTCTSFEKGTGHHVGSPDSWMVVWRCERAQQRHCNLEWYFRDQKRASRLGAVRCVRVVVKASEIA
jgi:hypothetical protein